MPPREGFTTGTAAAAAACAAFGLLLGRPPAPSVRVPLPPFGDDGAPSGFLDIPIQNAERVGPNSARAVVIKDGGDDPDVTHNASVVALVELIERAEAAFPASPKSIVLPGPLPVELRAGEGIGTVTLPGLPVPPGEPAVNPAPRRQLAEALAALAQKHSYGNALRVTLAIPGGEALARKTLNPRLGIVGGLSILGTHGTVRPFSHEAWQAAIAEGLDVARAVGCARVALSTGRRSERLLERLYPELPPQAFIQAADFAAFSLGAASGFAAIAWGCFFGKLIKLAQGLPSTHARNAPLDLAALASWCVEAGMSRADAAPLAACATASHALDLLLARPDGQAMLDAVARRAQTQARMFARGADVTIHLFHLNGKELARA